MILYISVLSFVNFPLSSLILLIWFFSLCFLMSLDNGLSILFILSKNQLLALLFFAIVSFVSFAFISAQMLKISFLLLNLGFFVSPFSSCFSWSVRLFIWLFSCFLRQAYIAINLLLNTDFPASHSLGVVVFSFLFASMYILVSFFFMSSVDC